MPEVLFKKVASLRPATLLKNFLAQVFSCEFGKISKNIFFHKTPPVAASGSTVGQISDKDVQCFLFSC